MSRHSLRKRVLIVILSFCVAALFLIAGPNASQAQDIVNVSPTTTDDSRSNSATGGRIHNLAMDPNNPQVLYAASEWGGVFKSTDRGLNWKHLWAHEPLAAWDVAVAPTANSQLLVTSLFDGRTVPETGVQLSDDQGETSFNQSAGINHPAGACLIGGRQGETSGFGIGVDPANANHIIIGTNCGIAESFDGGRNFAYIDPTPATLGSNSFYDVIIHNGGIVDICGQEGVFRRPAPTAGLPSPTFVPLALPVVPGPAGFPVVGLCTLAVSPVNPNTLFVANIAGVFESRNGGAAWQSFYPNPDGQGRMINIATNSRGGNQFDLWFGDINLYRRACADTAGAGGGPNCNPPPAGAPPLAGWINVTGTGTGAAHVDAGEVLFDNSVAVNACPVAYANDGGVYINQLTTSPGCQTPRWARPAVSPTALWVDHLAGVVRSEDNREGIFIALQDNGQFVTEDANRTDPTWTSANVGDVPEVEAAADLTVTTLGFFGTPAQLPPNYPGGVVNNTTAFAIIQCWDPPNRAAATVGAGPPPNFLTPQNFRNFRLQIQQPNPLVPTDVRYLPGRITSTLLPCNFHPPGLIMAFRPSDTYLRVPGGPTGTHVVATTRGIFRTTNIGQTTAPGPAWLPLGVNPPLNPCDIKSASNANVTGLASNDFFVRSFVALQPATLPLAGCKQRDVGQLWRARGVNGTWTLITTDNPLTPGVSQFGPYAVDPTDSNTIVALDQTYNPPQIRMTTDGGATWPTRLRQLEDLMTNGGRVKMVVNAAGAMPFLQDGAPYVQPSMFAFDPRDTRVVVAGGFNSGFFVSVDKGETWQNIGDPTRVTSIRTPNISHPTGVHFEHEDDGLINIYIGTRGRGVWRARLGLVVELSLDTLTVLDDRLGNQPMLGVTFGARHGGSPWFSPSTPQSPTFRLVSENTENLLQDVAQDVPTPIPNDTGVFRSPFVPFCNEIEPTFPGLPSRIFATIQGFERDRATRDADRQTHFDNFQEGLEGSLRDDIEELNDASNLFELADRVWATFRWGSTDDYVGSNAIVFDRDRLLRLAESPSRREEIRFFLPSAGTGLQYMVTGEITVSGISICR